jgi:hypothetical protein
LIAFAGQIAGQSFKGNADSMEVFRPEISGAFVVQIFPEFWSISIDQTAIPEGKWAQSSSDSKGLRSKTEGAVILKRRFSTGTRPSGCSCGKFAIDIRKVLDS